MTDVLPHTRELTINDATLRGKDARKIAASIRSNPILAHVTIEHAIDTDAASFSRIQDAVFHNQNITKLTFQSTIVDIKELSHGVRNMKHLETLEILGCQDFLNADANSFVNLFRSNRKLKCFNFEGNKYATGTSVADQVAAAFSRALRFRLSMNELSLWDCNLSRTGVSFIVQALKRPSSLQRLVLCSEVCDLDTANAVSLAEGIQQTRSLVRLEITFGGISFAGSNAIIQSLATNRSLREVYICGIKLDAAGQRSLATYIKENNIVERLDLERDAWRDFEDEEEEQDEAVLDLAPIASALYSNTTLKSLSISDFDIQGQDLNWTLNANDYQNGTLQELKFEYVNVQNGATTDWSPLWKLIEKCIALKEFSIFDPLSGLDGDSVLSLCASLKNINELESLSLDGSDDVGDEGAAFLGKFIANHATLKELSVSSSKITDVGFRSIGEAMKRNSTIQSLHVGGSSTNVSTSGVQAIIDGLKNHPAIERTQLSSESITQMQSAELDLHGEINRGIRPLLSMTLPIGLWPYVLERATNHSYSHRYSKVKAPADLVYYLVREKHAELLSSIRRTGKRKKRSW